MRFPTVGLVLVLALSPVIAADTGAPYAPAEVLVLPVGVDGAWITWVAGEEAADAYRVFGFASDGWHLLEEQPSSDPLMTQAPSGFSVYGVAGVLEAVQSPIVTASVQTGPCISVETTPPGIWVNCRIF